MSGLVGSELLGAGSVKLAGGDDAGAAGGVTSVNGDAGPAVVLTLASMYAFGLADVPASDNMFDMPSGNLRFPGYTFWGISGYAAAVDYFQDRAAIALASPPPYQLISMAANLGGIGGNGYGTFSILELNDPSWNGNFAALNGPWIAERAVFSRDVDQTNAHSATEYGRREYSPFGQSPMMAPAQGQIGFSNLHQVSLWNSQAGANLPVMRESGYGQIERQVHAVQNGASGQWVTHWNNFAAAPAAGDGPAWIVEVNGGFGVNSPAAALQAYQRGGDQVNSAWGWRLFGQDVARVWHTVLDVNTDGGTLNGAAIATLGAGATNVENYASAAVDLTALSSANLIVPARAGFIFVPREIIPVTTDVAGVLSTAPTVVLKTGASTLLTSSTLPGAAQFQKGQLTGMGIVTPAANPFLANTAITLDVTVAATGTGLTFKAVYALKGYWQALP